MVEPRNDESAAVGVAPASIWRAALSSGGIGSDDRAGEDVSPAARVPGTVRGMVDSSREGPVGGAALRTHEKDTRRSAGRFFVLALLILVVGAWERDLFDADEGRYASVAWGMAATGDYITPRLNGMPFMDKPPLVYWVQAAFYEVFGPLEICARIPTLMAGALWAWFIFLFAAAWTRSRRTAWFAGLLAATSCAGTIGSRVGPQMDMPLAAAIAGALYCGWRAIVMPSVTAQLGLGLAIGCGLLIKGPLAVAVPGLVAMGWIAAGVAPGRVVRAVFSPWSIGLALLVAAPWYVLVERAQPGWIEHFIRYEHFGRFSQGDHRAFHPFWFYVPIVLIYLAPWTLLAWGGARARGRPGALLGMFTCSPWWTRTWREVLPREEGIGRDGAPVDVARLAYLWFVVAFVLYSLATRKLLNYLLPAAAPLFVLVGARFERLLDKGSVRAWLLPAALGLVGLGASVLLWKGLWFPMQRGRLPASIEAPRYVAMAPWILAAGLAGLAPLVFLRARVFVRGTALIAGACLFWWSIDFALARVSHLGSSKALAHAAAIYNAYDAEERGSWRPVVALRRYPQGMGFYHVGLGQVWIAGGEPDAWWQREIVNPYAKRHWEQKRSRAFHPSFPDPPPGGLMTTAEFEEAWYGGRPMLLICRWREIQPLGARIIEGPFAGAGRTDLFLVVRADAP